MGSCDGLAHAGRPTSSVEKCVAVAKASTGPSSEGTLREIEARPRRALFSSVHAVLLRAELAKGGGHQPLALRLRCVKIWKRGEQQ